MDSFYDVPRRPPMPIPRDSFTAVPMVPEISVLCQSNTPKNNFMPYNEWKCNNAQNNFLPSNKENLNGHFPGHFQNVAQNNSILKKQVRFESPALQQRILESSSPVSNNKDINLVKNQNHNVVSHGQQAFPSKFEQVYMANIPNRQLDLSIIDLPKRVPGTELLKVERTKEKEQPKTYKQFMESQKIDKVVLNDSITDIYNYKRTTPQKDCSISAIRQNEYKNQYAAKPTHTTQPTDNNYKQISQNNYNLEMPGTAFNKSVPLKCDSSLNKGIENVINPKMHKFETPLLHGNFDSKPSQNLIFTTDNLGTNSPQRQSEEASIQNKCEYDKSFMPMKADKQNYHMGKPDSPAFTKNTFTSVQEKHDCSTQTLNNSSTDNMALKIQDDFSVKDLLKIIAQQSQQMSQQSEQILILQRQVSELISQQKEENNSRQRSIQYRRENECFVHNRECCEQNSRGQTHGLRQQSTDQNPVDVQNKYVTSTQHENWIGGCEKSELTPRKNKKKLPNFSIGLTTSFEVSFRRPNKSPNEFFQKISEINQGEHPKIQEITDSSTPDNGNYEKNCQHNQESDNKETLVDASMVFREPIRVREPCPSPEPSIKIQMNDFEDSESDDEVTTPEIGASFYRNLMVQVNKILQKAQIETAQEVAYNLKGSQLKNETLHKVKEATLKHLKRIGVEVHNSDDSSHSSNSSENLDGKNYNEEDISFAVKQLLMKYLPADHLAKVGLQEDSTENHIVCTPKNKIGAIKNRPEFSFATLQYMRKYNLIANNQKDISQPKRMSHPESPKILDISKLKQQPKLL